MDAEATRDPAGPYRSAADGPRSIVSLRGVWKTFWRGREPVNVLENLDLDVAEGAFEAFTGPSGAGKSTLLHLIAGLDRPTKGTLEVAGVPIGELPDTELARWRSRNIGFVFQSYNLMPVLTAAQNVELPLLFLELPAAERRRRVEAALSAVGLVDRRTSRPNQLSAGEEQRLALARAIVNDPTLLVVDDPTAELDGESAAAILALLEKLHREQRKSIVMVTRDAAVAERADVKRRLERGKLL